MSHQVELTPDTFKVLLKKLVQTPDDFTPEDCADAFKHLCVQGASEAQVSMGTYAHSQLWGRSVPRSSL